MILSFCVVTFTSIFFLRIRDFNALYSALSSFSSVYAMSSFAVFIFLFWKSVIAWCAIFVYFPLVGISADSVTPLYSIFISYSFVLFGYLYFVEFHASVMRFALTMIALVVLLLLSWSNSILLLLLARLVV